MIFKYCPLCANQLEISGKYPICYKCGETFYQNSKPAASVLPIRGEEVLLTKRARAPFKGSLDIIGGFLEDGEHPYNGAIREVLEETGLQIKLTGMLGIYMDTYSEDPIFGDSTLNIHYIGEVIDGEIKALDDAESLHWLKIDSLNITSGFINTQEALRDLVKHWRYDRLNSLLKQGGLVHYGNGG